MSKQNTPGIWGICLHCVTMNYNCRLREMLRQEEEQYMLEVEDKQETMLERQAKMRERAKFLKEKREKERLEFVEQKLDERWR